MGAEWSRLLNKAVRVESPPTPKWRCPWLSLGTQDQCVKTEMGAGEVGEEKEAPGRCDLGRTGTQVGLVVATLHGGRAVPISFGLAIPRIHTPGEWVKLA